MALVLAVLLPSLVFSAAAAWEALRQQDAAAQSRLLDTAQALAAALDMQVSAKVAALRALAASAHAEDGLDPLPEHFVTHARTTAAIFGGWVNLYRRDGSQAFSTRLPTDGPMPGPGGGRGPGGGGRTIAEVFDTGQPAISDVAEGRLSGRPHAFVFVPLRVGEEVRAVLGMPLLAERLAATLAGQASQGRGTVALTDSRGTFAARSREPERVVGQQRPPRGDGPLGLRGVVRGRALADGEAIRTAYHALAAAPGWHVWVNEPEVSFTEARRLPLLALAGGGVLALAVGLAGAGLIARRLLTPVQALVERAEAVAGGAMQPFAAAPAPPARIAEFERLRQAVTDAEAALRRVQRIGRVGGFEIDLRTGRNQRSAEYMAVQGRPLSPAEEQHVDWVRRLHPDDRARAEARFLAAVADHAPDTDYDQEYRIVTPSGEVRWIYARAEIERDPAGCALRMVGAHVDVTPLKAAEAALRDSEERLRLALEAARLGAWEVDLITWVAQRTPRALEIFGYGRDAAAGLYPSWRDRVHPQDRARLAEAVEAVRAGRIAEYRIEYRFLRPDGCWVWIESQGRAAGADPVTGKPTRLIGTSLDITERKEAEERQAVLVHELDHRAKNTLAVVQAALRLTPRTDVASYARAVEGRVSALARAHTLLAKARWRGADLRLVAEDALAPFLGAGADGPTAAIGGPPLALAPPAVQALSMALHELATNAAKHGALSTPAGHVDLSWAISGASLDLAWDEQGGPALAAPPTGRGFGTSLVSATIARQLGGEQRATWRGSGLLWVARLPLERLTAAAEPETAAPPAEARAIPEEASASPAPA